MKSCTVVSLLQCNLVCNILMTLAINAYIICHLTLVIFYTTWHYTKMEELCCSVSVSSVSGSEKNWFRCVWSGSELVVWLDHSRCSKWRPFAFTYACSHVCYWLRQWCPEEYGPKCHWASSSAHQCMVLCNVR